MFAPPQEQDSVAAVEETLVKGEETKHFSDFVKPGSFQTDTTTKDYIDRGLWSEKSRSTSSKENCKLKVSSIFPIMIIIANQKIMMDTLP